MSKFLYIKYKSEYQAWSDMKRRCYNKNYKEYHYYGGRGITICERWKNSFSNFLEDLGAKPAKNLSIDRINNEGNYEPSNCRWATKNEQGINQRSRKHSSKYRGVYVNKKDSKYKAAIRVEGRKVYLGTFLLEADAALAYNEAAQKYHGRYAMLNIIGDNNDSD